MKSIDDSYRYCRKITTASGSNFCRAFSLLPPQQRKGMETLYAFARIADDQSDSVSPSNPIDKVATQCELSFAPNKFANQSNNKSNWSGNLWRQWIRELYAADFCESTGNSANTCTEVPALISLRPALKHTVDKFRIPESVFCDLVDGIDFDQSESVAIESWQELRKYCEQVASSVGIACVAIWNGDRAEPLMPAQYSSANACGIAFQLTNILRDVVEDAGRNRCYLPQRDLNRFGLDLPTWFEAMSDLGNGKPLASVTKGKILSLMDVYLEKAAGHYRVGARLLDTLPLPSQRIFSLMHATYYSLLKEIQKKPMEALERRASLSKFTKLNLAATHVISPLYSRFNHHFTNENIESERTHKVPSSNTLQVAVVGGGLSGIQAALDLARHGVKVTLLESKSRLGGRAGSFWDSQSDESVDYCQHVGMKCCTALQRWIHLMEQSELWEEIKELHFVSKSSKHVSIRAWPLPAPFHLGSVLWNWPDLTLSDRFNISTALTKLFLWKPSSPGDSALPCENRDALSWLHSNNQTERSISRFWNVILVSALGELPQNVSVAAMKKVLIDGFAGTRDASHLLIPKAPLSELTNRLVQTKLSNLGVAIRLSTSVKQVVQNGVVNKTSIQLNDGSIEHFDAVILSTNWKHASSILPLTDQERETLALIESSPISGVHTWWDKAWLEHPHGIFIDSFCQWVFPGVEKEKVDGGGGVYYQIVISASRNLRGMTDADIAERIQSEVRARFPMGSDANLIRLKLVTDPNAVFTISPSFEMNRWTTDRFASKGIYLAGDWTDTGWPTTMEGALRSGISAATNLLQDFDHPIAPWTDQQ